MSTVRALTIAGTPSTKRFLVDATTGWTIYGIVTREADGYLLADADGIFAAAPADPHHEFAEDATVKGRYAFSEARTAWNSGDYSIAVYRQLAGSPTPATDTLLGIGGLHLTGDTEADAGSVLLVEYALCSLAQVKTEMQIASGNTDEDARISRAINDGTDRLETIFRRKVMKRAASSVEYHDRPWKLDDGTQCLWPSEYPVESTGDVTGVDAGTAASRSALTLTNLTVYRQRVLVFPNGGITTSALGNKLTFRPGYTTCPHDLQGVAIGLAQRLYWEGKRQEAGDTEQSAGGVSRRKEPLAFSAADQLIIDAYTRKESGVWPRGTEWIR